MKKDFRAELIFLELPNNEEVFPLLGARGIKNYGIDDNGCSIKRNHFHNLMEIGICRKGNGIVILGEKEYSYKSGTIIIIPANFTHMIKSDIKEKSFWEFIYVKPSKFLEKIFVKDIKKKKKYLEQVEHRAFIKDKENVSNMMMEIDLIMNQFRVQEYGYRECVKGLVFSLLMEIVKINHNDNEKPDSETEKNPQKVAKLSKALEFIEENYNKELHVSDIADAAFISETYLRRLFAECCSVSPMQYVNLIRIDTACKMIKTTDANINEIAYKVGFDNMTTFINNFKRITGYTPKQWKQNIRQKKK